MKLITKQSKIDGIAAAWKHQYCRRGKWIPSRPTGLQHSQIYTDLCALPKDATEEDITGIIGNSTWTSLVCEECGQEVDTVIQLGEDCDTLDICLTCLNKAVKIMEEGQ